MKRSLRLIGTDEDGARFRDSYPFPSQAASALTPATPRPSVSPALPFPLSHPENQRAMVVAKGTRLGRDDVKASARGSIVGAGELGVIPTRDLIRQIDLTLDRIKAKTDDLRDQIDNYPFPDANDDDRPRAA